MKRLYLFLLLFLGSAEYRAVIAQSVGIGTSSPSSAAQLDITSTTKGVLIPRMTQAERDLIVPVQGLMIFNTSSNSFQYHNGSVWANMAHSGIISGTPNKIPKFVGLWGLTPGLMTDNGAGIAINTNSANPDASALLDMASTTKGVLVPRMTYVQRNGIVLPATGLLIYQTDFVSGFYYFDGTVWTPVTSAGNSKWDELNGNIYNNNAGNVGIGASTPFAKLTVNGDANISSGLGIATTSPDLITYKLDVNGSARTRLDHYVSRDLWVDHNLDVDGTSNLFGNIIAGSNVSIGGSITAVDNVTVSGNVTVDAGKGIVRSTNGSQRVVTFPSGSVSFGNAPAGYTTDITFAFSNVFAATPIITLGQITNESGNFERWTYTIHSVDLATRTFIVRFYTANGTGGGTAMTLNFIAIGTAL